MHNQVGSKSPIGCTESNQIVMALFVEETMYATIFYECC